MNNILHKSTFTVDQLIEFSHIYASTGKPICVNFRELVPEINSKERYSHLIHSYPAKLLCNIPYYFLSSEVVCPIGGIVLDPFCGTGTVLLEAILSGRNAYGADANPLAVLISKVKTTYIQKDRLIERLISILYKAERTVVDYNVDEDVIHGWFSKSTILQLRKLEKTISKITNQDEYDFFKMCFSNLIKKVSFADSSISVPVKLNPDRFPLNSARYKAIDFKLKTLQNIDVFDKFDSICRINIERINTLKIIGDDVQSEVISNDARFLTKHYNDSEKLQDCSVDLVMTSPPYAGAQKYIRSSRLNLYWLGTRNAKEIRELNNKNIGREDYHSNEYSRQIVTGITAADEILSRLYNEGKYERACIVGNYLNEMKVALHESYRVLKEKGYMILIIGNNTVGGYPFNTQEYLSDYLCSLGMSLQFKLIDDIKSYGLMTKRNRTANLISSEWVLVFKK